jgi:hypothetical protein
MPSSNGQGPAHINGMQSIMCSTLLTGVESEQISLMVMLMICLVLDRQPVLTSAGTSQHPVTEVLHRSPCESRQMQPTFQKLVVPSPAGSNSPKTRLGWLDPEEEGSMILWNVWNCPLDSVTSQKIVLFSSTAAWTPNLIQKSTRLQNYLSYNI